MRRITEPLALVRVNWVGADRRPESGSTMAATAVFVLGDDAEVVPDWPAGGEHFSVMLEFIDSPSEPGSSNAKVDFLARDEVTDRLQEGAVFLLMAGRTPIAEVRVIEALWPPSA